MNTSRACGAQNGAQRRLGDRFFMRGDRTLCYVFAKEELMGLFASAGLACVECKVLEREVRRVRGGEGGRGEGSERLPLCAALPPVVAPTWVRMPDCCAIMFTPTNVLSANVAGAFAPLAVA